MNEGRPIAPNDFKANEPGTPERDAAQAAIERIRREGGVFVEAVRATRMPMVLTDPNLPGNPIVFANQAFLKLSGYSMDDVLGQQPHFMNGPGTDPNDAARFREMIRADQDEVLETVQYRKNGSRFVANVLLSAFKAENGQILHHFMSWLDVTRRVEAELEVSDLRKVQKALRDSESHAQLLLAELQHRVRNTFAVVRSIARRTAERSETMEEMVSHFEGRLNAFSRVQSSVSRNPGSGIGLETIIEDELISVAAREGEQFRIKGPEVCLRSKAAETISLAIHELATNAVKYGALSTKQGRIKVSWNVKTLEDGARRLRLEWLETGLDEAPKPGHEGFGHEMLRRTLPYDLAAETDIMFTDDGMRFTLDMPVGGDVLAEERA